MVKAFVFGKFLPFHKGHEAMIRFALTKCDWLTVLVCCSDKENIPDSVRKNWIEKTFIANKNIEVKCLNYAEKELPNTSVSSKDVSKIWSQKFKTLFPDYNLLVSSEPYGNFVAAFMGIKHIAFDLPRKTIPISATRIRSDLFENWNFLPDSVKPDFAIKVVLLGTESTGKSTLTKRLSQHYNCNAVMEAGRDLIPDSNTFVFEDLNLVAQEHAKRIEEAVLGESPLIIIDTDIHITMSYAKFMFGKLYLPNKNIYQSNKANLYLYLKNDASYVQDGTRLSEVDRNLLDASHRLILKKHNIEFMEISGDWEDRYEMALKFVDELIAGEVGNYTM